ncbi:D-Ala-D-Ala carboxypeptidase family metallohydrolase [Micromonospora sp. NBS 11-29]|uniref:D-Ala-D-Ala carboxypeptidase family metallohydrolase n=1 Tax=Micromonospora sp. NBS 11-29 TaxID=1960879 RepID=UPI000B798846|nr:D-Ala-D-Ala carboxypeptidase family metallohydrolase [Micromonospora sp. NBS 11-29]
MRKLIHRLGRALAAGVLAVCATGVAVTATGGAAYADGCYTWGRSLASGATGEDVRQLQIRLAGYPGYNAVLGLDGSFGPATRSALIRFQQAYGLTADGVAGPQTYNKLYALQDDDCTPVNFAYAELNTCNSNWSGGAVSAATARANALVAMWKLQALRHALGDQSIRVNGAFRSYACNSAAGGVANSRHLYGDGVDLGSGPHSLCRLAQQARNHGFQEVLGPGYPNHNDHTHVATAPYHLWSAPTCGI